MAHRRISGGALAPAKSRAFLQTTYRVGAARILVGKRSYRTDNVLHGLGARTGILLTAWNPLSRKMPEGWNRRMQKRLFERARRWSTAEGLGGDAEWAEEHLLVAADPRAGLRLAHIFRQRAVIVLRHGQAPTLFVLS